jgi:hypothetical protein
LASRGSRRSALLPQGDVEPIGIDYAAPAGCPDEDAFFREIVARTTRARSAKPGDNPRTLHVVVAKRGDFFAGRLWIEETATSSRAREVSGTTCGEVVGALGLIAALAIDPSASIAPRPALQAAAPTVTPLPDAGARDQPASAPGGSRQPGQEAQARTRALPARFASGVELEVSMIADAVLAGRVFGEIEIGDPRRTWAPSLRVALGRSLDTERRVSAGGATLRFTQASFEVCPLRAAITASLSMRPCVGGSGGVLEAQGRDVNAAQSQTRPWATTFAHARFVWEPVPALGVELEAGALAPLYRDSFYFKPNIPVYQAPQVAFLGRAGLCVRFP